MAQLALAGLIGAGYSGSALSQGDRAEVFVQLGHRSAATAVAFSPDGRRIASASLDGTVKIWDAASGREMLTLRGHEGAVTSVAFSPNGASVVSSGRDRTLRIWDLARGAELKTLSGHDSVIFAVAVSPADGRIASASYDRSVRIWDPATGQALRVLRGHGAPVRSVAFSRDGKLLVSAGDDKAVRLWDAATGSELRGISGQASGILSVAVSGDGRLIAGGAQDGSIRLWSAATGEERRVLAGHSGAVTGVAFAADGRLIASSSNDGTVRLWDTDTGREVRSFRGEAGDVFGVAFSPTGKTLASAGQDHAIRLWDVASGATQNVLRGRANEIRGIAFSPDGKALATVGADRAVRVWDLQAGNVRRTFLGHSGPVNAVRFSPDGSLVASAGQDRTVRLWDVASGTEFRVLRGHAGEIHAIAFAPDGLQIASAGNDDAIRLTNLVSGELLRAFRGHQGSVRDLSFSADGRRLASASYDDTVRIWDAATGAEIRVLKGHANRVNSVAFAPDGLSLISGGEDASVRIWDATGAREAKVLAGHSGPVRSVAISADGRMIASAGLDGRLLVWDAATGNVLRSPVSDAGQLDAVAFSRSGLLASAGDAGVTVVWGAQGGRERARLFGFNDGEWVSMVPEGFFNGSQGGFRYLNVRLRNEVHSLDQFVESFFRPDLVQVALASATQAGAAAESDETGRQPAARLASQRLSEVKPAPHVEIIDTPGAVDAAQVTVRLRVTDVGGGIGDVRLYLNGTAVLMETVRGLQSGARSDGAALLRYEVRLVNGRNELRAVAFNADNTMQSQDAVQEIAASIGHSRRPSLHAVVVGIQEFANPRLKLNFSGADAQLFAKVLREQAASLFESVNIRLLLTAEETTNTAIVRALNAVRDRIGPEDLFVFYVASHGTVDEGEYFLITSNVGSASTAKLKTDAIGQKSLTQLIANIPSTKKLIVLDTCNAGKLGDAILLGLLSRGLSEDTAAKILSRAVGATILSAATSQQEALEGYQGHGLFTWVIAEGLKGGADADKDGFVKTTELADYVDNQVPEIAEKLYRHKQYPIISPSGMGFPVTRVR